MSRSYENEKAEEGPLRRTPKPKWIKEIVSGRTDPEATEENGGGRRGGRDRPPDPRPHPEEPKPDGSSAGGNGSPEQSPHCMAPELAQPLGDFTIRSSGLV